MAIVFESNSSYVGREVPCLVSSSLATRRDSVWGEEWTPGLLARRAGRVPGLQRGCQRAVSLGKDRQQAGAHGPSLGDRGPALPRSFLTLSALLSRRLLRYTLNSQLFVTSKLL